MLYQRRSLWCGGGERVLTDLSADLPSGEVLQSRSGDRGVPAVAAGPGSTGGDRDTSEITGVVDAELKEVRIVGLVLDQHHVLGFAAIFRRVAETSLEAGNPRR